MEKKYTVKPEEKWQIRELERNGAKLDEVCSYLFDTKLEALKFVDDSRGNNYLYTVPEKIQFGSEPLLTTRPSWIVYVEGKGYFDGEVVFHEDGKSDIGNTIHSEKAYLFYDKKAAQAVAYLVKGETVPSGQPGYFIK